MESKLGIIGDRRRCGIDSIAKLIIIFFLCSLIGDWIETVYVYIVSGELMNRASLVHEGISLVWGIGGVILTVILYFFKDRSSYLIFFVGFLVGGVYEYICGFVLESSLDITFWNYSEIPLNLDGRVNLLFCVFWGILAFIWIKYIFPAINLGINGMKRGFRVGIAFVLLAFVTLDLVLSVSAIRRYVQRSQGIEPKNAIEVYVDVHYPNECIKQAYPDMEIKE